MEIIIDFCLSFDNGLLLNKGYKSMESLKIHMTQRAVATNEHDDQFIRELNLSNIPHTNTHHKDNLIVSA